jgi:cytoskeletal protein CcmA (bactofilin family)
MSMWKKTDSRPDEPQIPMAEPARQAPAAPQPTHAPAQAQATAQQPARPSTGAPAVIGPSITVKGDVIGEEDLVIDGRVEGEIRVNRHSVTVGRNGKIKADIHAKSIQVEGEVLGNLWGDEAVVIRRTGKVNGNVTAPRVTLEDGSTFRGSIDMQPPQQASDARKQAGGRTDSKSDESASHPAAAGVAHAAHGHAQGGGQQGNAGQRRERTA